RKIEGFAPSAVSAMLSYNWPGNVRELQNRVEHAIVMGQSAIITTNELFPEGLPRVEAQLFETPAMEAALAAPDAAVIPLDTTDEAWVAARVVFGEGWARVGPVIFA